MLYCLAITVKYRFEIIKMNFRLVLFTIRLFHYKGNTFILLSMIMLLKKNTGFILKIESSSICVY